MSRSRWRVLFGSFGCEAAWGEGLLCCLREGRSRANFMACMRKELAVLCVLALCVAGCKSAKNAAPAFRAGDETMPEFLNGPAVALLTNSGGYSAHVATDIVRPYAGGKALSGALLQRNGRLVFQPDQIVVKKKRPTAGLIFIWDANLRQGWTMSEALQGYAPVEGALSATNVQFDSAAGIPEMIDNHPCHRYEARVGCSDGSVALYKVWQADDLRHFPVRIQSDTGGKPMTLDFSDVLFDPPSETLFNPPDGFVRYSSPVALMNELIIRETTVGEEHEPTEYSGPPPRSATVAQPLPAQYR